MKEKKLDIDSLNVLIKTCKKIVKIVYPLLVISIILLLIFISKQLKLVSLIQKIFDLTMPLLIGIIIAWLFEPIVKYLKSKGIKSSLATGIIYLLFIGLIILLLYLVIPPFIVQIKDFISNVPNIIEDIKSFINNVLLKSDKINLEGLRIELYKALNKMTNTLTKTAPSSIINFSKNILGGLINFVLGIMIGFYLSLDFSKVNNGIKSIMPNTWIKNYEELIKRINTSLRSYVQGVFLVMVLVFITQAIGLSIAGLKTPLVFALFCAVTDIIPYFGPYIGAIPAILMGFSMNPLVGIATIIAIVIVQSLENYFYQPIIMGKAMELHPVTIMVGLIIFGNLFGIFGMVFATPMIATIKVIVKFIDEKYELEDKLLNKKNKVNELL